MTIYSLLLYPKGTMWKLWIVLFGQNEDYNAEYNTSDSTEKLLQRERGDRSACMWFWWRWTTCNQVLQNVFSSLMELLLVKRNSGHHEDFSAFPDTRRYMNWAHKLAPENVYLKTSPVSLCLTIWRPVVSVFPGAQRASLLPSTLNSFPERLKISTVAAQIYSL